MVEIIIFKELIVARKNRWKGIKGSEYRCTKIWVTEVKVKK